MITANMNREELIMAVEYLKKNIKKCRNILISSRESRDIIPDSEILSLLSQVLDNKSLVEFINSLDIY